MDAIPVVTVFVRHRGEVLLLRRSDDVDSYPGRWGTVAGHVEDASPVEAARDEIAEETGLREHEVTLTRKGPPFDVKDEDRGTRWRVHPFLFDAETRSITLNWEADAAEWAAPTALLRRDTVPDLWTSYRRVAPSVVDLTDDTTHGSAYLSVRALEVLRDRAGRLATTEADDIEDARARLHTLAQRLLDARPSMAALANRIHRVMHAGLPDLVPADVEAAAHHAIDRALQADAGAAETAADLLDGRHVLTLSRSGTVREALRQASPAAVVVAASQPGGEGTAVAERLSDDGHDVTLVPDAAVATTMADVDLDLVLVGADAVHPSGTVVNKVGTRGAALAARHEDLPFYAACTVDKVAVDASPPTEDADRQAVYDGPAPLQVRAPRFDVTPPALVTGGVATERGVLAPDALGDVADELRQLRDWM